MVAVFIAAENVANVDESRVKRWRKRRLLTQKTFEAATLMSEKAEFRVGRSIGINRSNI